MRSAKKQTVYKRRVFYFPGFDPFPPRRYREMYRSESAQQATISRYEISQRALAGKYGWQIDAVMGDQSVQTEMSVLVWSDLVRSSMNTSIPGTYWQLLRTAWNYILSGAIFRIMRLRKGPVIAAFYPVVGLLIQLFLALVLGALVFSLSARLLPGWGASLGVVLGAATAVGFLIWCKKRDGIFYIYYLMHDFAHAARLKGAYSGGLEARLATFGDLISEALTSDVDEVLVVGHSSGAHLAVTVLSDLIRAGRVPETGPVLSLLSLGHVVPMVAFLPNAQRLRADLAFLSRSECVTWVDVTAPGDGCTFALCDPVSVCGVAPPDKKWPLVVTAAFSKTLSPDRWQKVRRRYYYLHFQYLRAFERPEHYDYFAITAGPMTLKERYEDVVPSPSRIETPTSKFTSVAA